MYQFWGWKQANIYNFCRTFTRICRIETNSETFFSEIHDCFGEIGTLNTTHHIEVKENVKPVVTLVHKVPHALKPKLEKELKRMVDLDIIEPIEEPTDWVNGLVVVEKPNEKLHICLDPRPLNNAIKREHLHLPTAEEIFSQMSGACFFSKLDASSGYWQIKVEEGKLISFSIRYPPNDVIALKDYPTEFTQPAKFSNEKLPLLFQMSLVVLTLKMIYMG